MGAKTQISEARFHIGSAFIKTEVRCACEHDLPRSMRDWTLAVSEARVADWAKKKLQSAVLFKKFELGLVRFARDYGAKVQR